MGSKPLFRALSLDLGETVWWDTPEHGVRHDATRVRILSESLVGPDGRTVEPEKVAGAWNALRAELRAAGRSPRTLSTPDKIDELARRTGSHFTLPREAVTDRFAFAGLDTDPPTVTSEAVQLVTQLNHWGVPGVAISNTQRTGEAWRRFLGSRGMRFEFVITSSDREYSKPDPRLFREASERLSLPFAEILHIGDRWETDVVGALSVGMGAALYRGLWSRHWDRDEGIATDPGTHPEVARWDDLTLAEDCFTEHRPA
ncbi:MAG: HAD family hydrolase [Thermoplasmata archaeon]